MTDRNCITCGTAFTVSAKNPNRRFCSPRCRVADWHARNHRAEHRDVRNDVPPANGVPAANGVHRCPHCQHELAVISVVVPADAAHVRLPQVKPHDPPSRLP
jgi:endogenous inhibitor of DNA gyrase (YacG/DUF329 family)